MVAVSLSNVSKSFGTTEVLKAINLDVEDGEFVVFVGPSGCGKSTLLRIICGLEEVTAGTVAMAGEVVNDVSPADRGIAMVFQNYALYPHMTVAENMGYALRLAGVDQAEIRSRVQAAAQVLRLDALLQRKPRELSGGQRQRVAIGRAIVRDPRLFLFDEPLSNLDAALRVDMRAEIAALKERLGSTMIYVTHDQIEAMTLADKIVVMNGGHIEQTGSPLDLYRKPANRFVAGFLGSPRMNFIPATINAAGQPETARGCIFPVVADTQKGTSVTVGIRAEHTTLCPTDRNGALSGQARMIEHLGSDVFVHLSVADVPEAVILRVSGEQTISLGDTLGFAPDPSSLHVFDVAGLRLGTGSKIGDAA
jgi:multiple sugar transport system ATP-binding protein